MHHQSGPFKFLWQGEALAAVLLTSGPGSLGSPSVQYDLVFLEIQLLKLMALHKELTHMVECTLGCATNPLCI